LCLKVGIPRSLFYYKFAVFWESFFPALGADVVVSDQTNKRILDDGVKFCVDEACLPIKLFYGHVLNLAEKVDYVLVPRFTSISRNEYICPEFGGLPDMIRHTLKGIPEIISTEVNMRKSDKGGIRAAIETGAILGADRRTAVKAYRTALEKLRRNRPTFISKCVCAKGENRPQGGKCQEGENRPQESKCQKGENCPQKCIGVIGHPYNVYDRYISMDLLGKLSRYGVEVRTVEMVDEADINAQASKLAKPMFWNYGRLAYGAALHMAEAGEVDGFICISSFGCGIDSFVHDLIERSIRKKFGIPLITMTIDEHTGEAGFDTRLEAFVDMLQWRRQNESYFSASG
jgi:predicted nucleotide-binding protein (sugar kinase/HSP70/actin superfamily)